MTLGHCFHTPGLDTADTTRIRVVVGKSCQLQKGIWHGWRTREWTRAEHPTVKGQQLQCCLRSKARPRHFLELTGLVLVQVYTRNGLMTHLCRLFVKPLMVVGLFAMHFLWFFYIYVHIYVYLSTNVCSILLKEHN